MFENKVLRKIFGIKREEVIGEWRKLYNAELKALYSSPGIIRNMKSRRLGWTELVARRSESRSAYRVLVRRSEGKNLWKDQDIDVSQSKQARLVCRSSTRVCVRICVSIRRPEFECSGPQLEGPVFECSGPQLEGPEFEYSELKTSHRHLIDLRTRSQTPGVLRMSSEHATIRFRRDSKSGTPLINRQHIHFLHDGAPAHFSRTARRYLDRRFPDRWIGRGGPIAWPPRSPDLNPLDFYLWGHLKSLVYSSPVPDLESLRNRIVACSEDIRNTPGVWDRVRRSMRHRCEVCIQAGGGHFEHLL
ncbi:hypothetical protein ANN_06400 [Periplaneta americana]|uniref:Uncharacterized protein n=1 Tax=Periplaneta americana TaxID=6978 RepID=A0ABQ8TF63_PERAM|nr:hypothetical protein ANN_06400 [Periplaneta americana]